MVEGVLGIKKGIKTTIIMIINKKRRVKTWHLNQCADQRRKRRRSRLKAQKENFNKKAAQNTKRGGKYIYVKYI